MSHITGFPIVCSIIVSGAEKKTKFHIKVSNAENVSILWRHRVHAECNNRNWHQRFFHRYLLNRHQKRPHFSIRHQDVYKEDMSGSTYRIFSANSLNSSTLVLLNLWSLSGRTNFSSTGSVGIYAFMLELEMFVAAKLYLAMNICIQVRCIGKLNHQAQTQFLPLTAWHLLQNKFEKKW